MPKKPKDYKEAGGFAAWFEFMFTMSGENPISNIRKPKKKKKKGGY